MPRFQDFAHQRRRLGNALLGLDCHVQRVDSLGLLEVPHHRIRHQHGAIRDLRLAECLDSLGKDPDDPEVQPANLERTVERRRAPAEEDLGKLGSDQAKLVSRLGVASLEKPARMKLKVANQRVLLAGAENSDLHRDAVDDQRVPRARNARDSRGKRTEPRAHGFHIAEVDIVRFGRGYISAGLVIRIDQVGPYALDLR